VSVTLSDVRHVAALARLGLDDARAETFVAQLNTILAHMEVLSRVDTRRVQEAVGVGAAGAPLRGDQGRPTPMERGVDSVAPRMEAGFFLVPRLSTHEDPEEA
jgi:aspartyl-tRNA(Asn)/glutamyl-tRNA(Gln) amidotransferase subunit C